MKQIIQRRCVWVAAWLFGIYLLTILVFVAGEERLAFPGWTFPKPWVEFPRDSVVDDVRITSADGNLIHAWWLPPPANAQTGDALIYIHGNRENLSTCAKTLLRWKSELNTGVLGFDYPGFGRSTGTPNEQSCYAAAQAAFDWVVTEKKLAATDIIVVGQSIGGAVATELVCRRPCRLLLTSGAFTSFADAAQHRFFWLPARHLVRLRFDNLGKMTQLETPVFITHGTDDCTVPFSQGERLAKAARSRKQFYPVPGGKHSLPKTEEFFDAVRQFLSETKSTNPGA